MLRNPAFSLLLLVMVTSGCDAASSPAPFAESTLEPAGTQLTLQGRVNDAAGVLDAAAERRLADRLEAFESRTKHQMVVVTTSSLDGEDIAEYTRNLANRWGIGRKGHDDGIVVLVAPNERKVRLAVGFGLERKLPDAFCKRVIEREIVPRFKQGDFAGGIEEGIAAMSAELK